MFCHLWIELLKSSFLLTQIAKYATAIDNETIYYMYIYNSNCLYHVIIMYINRNVMLLYIA